MYCYVWEFEVRLEHVEAFELAYGTGGDWVRLFRRDPGYIRTELLRALDSPTRFVTIDVWTSRQACLEFKQRHSAEFAAIDANCQAFTLRETLVGEYDLLN